MPQTVMQQPFVQSGPLAGPVLDLLLLEFSVCAMSAGILELGSLGRATAFAAVARTCGPFASEPSRDERSISVNALAASLGRPFETTRRTANALIGAGLLIRSEAGLRVAAAAHIDPRVARFGNSCHDLLVRLIEDLHAAGLALPPGRSEMFYDPRTGTGLAFDLFLAAFECHDGDDCRLLRIALLTAVEWINRRPGIARHLGQQPTPARPSMVARRLGLPYATAARNLDQLARTGALTRKAGGLTIGAAHSEGSSPAARREIANRARQLIGRLAQSGFPMHMPSAGYAVGRPPIPALG